MKTSVKAIILLAILAAAVWEYITVQSMDELIDITWRNEMYQITEGKIILLLTILIFLICAVMFFFTLLKRINKYIIRTIRRCFGGIKDRTDIHHLAIDLSGGEYTNALKTLDDIRKAQKHEETEKPVDALRAWVAIQAKDYDLAAHIYSGLMQVKSWKYAACMGLTRLHYKQSDWVRVADYAQKALAINKNSLPAMCFLLDALIENQIWDQALETASLIKNHADFSSQFHCKTTDYKIACIQLLQIQSISNKSQGLKQALKFVAKNPDFIPGILWTSSQLIEQENATKKAKQLITSAWKIQPHVSLLQSFSEMLSHGKSYNSCDWDELITQNPSHKYSILLRARCAIAAENWKQADQILETSTSSFESNEEPVFFLLKALIEQNFLHNHHQSGVWLMKAIQSSSLSPWQCQSCGGNHDDWSHFCNFCHSFGEVCITQRQEGKYCNTPLNKHQSIDTLTELNLEKLLHDVVDNNSLD